MFLVILEVEVMFVQDGLEEHLRVLVPRGWVQRARCVVEVHIFV